MTRTLRPTGSILLHASILTVAASRRLTRDQVVDQLCEGEAGTHADLRAAIADHLYHALVPDHSDLRSIHLFGSSTDATCGISSDVDLLVHIARPDSSVVRTLQRINREMSREYVQVTNHGHSRFMLLDIHVVTDDEVKQRSGFAAILTSIHAPPYRLGRTT